MESKQQGLTAPAPARALPDDDEPTIGDLQRELARLRLSRDTWKTRAQKAARRLIDALPDHASCASAELREFRMAWAAYKGFRDGMGDMSDFVVAIREQTVSQLSDAVIDELLAK